MPFPDLMHATLLKHLKIVLPPPKSIVLLTPWIHVFILSSQIVTAPRTLPASSLWHHDFRFSHQCIPALPCSCVYVNLIGNRIRQKAGEHEDERAKVTHCCSFASHYGSISRFPSLLPQPWSLSLLALVILCTCSMDC